EMQRAAIGRAIIHRPPLILADEPTGNLDSKNGAMVLDLMRGMHQAHRPTIVMATHSAQAAARGDYIIEVADGHVQSKLKMGNRKLPWATVFNSPLSIFNFRSRRR